MYHFFFPLSLVAILIFLGYVYFVHNTNARMMEDYPHRNHYAEAREATSGALSTAKPGA